MSEKKDGGPAFPSSNKVVIGPVVTSGEPGMTLRDYFAGQAISGILAGIKNQQDIRNNYHHAADEAYGYADAMLAERDK